MKKKTKSGILPSNEPTRHRAATFEPLAGGSVYAVHMLSPRAAVCIYMSRYIGIYIYIDQRRCCLLLGGRGHGLHIKLPPSSFPIVASDQQVIGARARCIGPRMTSSSTTLRSRRGRRRGGARVVNRLARWPARAARTRSSSSASGPRGPWLCCSAGPAARTSTWPSTALSTGRGGGCALIYRLQVLYEARAACKLFRVARSVRPAARGCLRCESSFLYGVFTGLCCDK